MILQDTWLFSDTIKENIRYGSLDATSDEIINVSKQVNVDDFALQLPKAYNTILNEDTDNISHGQNNS